MKILEVESVVANLVQSTGGKLGLADLEFKNENCRTDEQNSVDALAHSRDRIFKVNDTLTASYGPLENIDFFQPSITLCLLQRERVVRDKFGENLAGSRGSEFSDGGRIEFAFHGRRRSVTDQCPCR